MIGQGNSLANVIIANTEGDTLIGGKGNDTLYGGAGDDTYVFSAGDGKDIVIADPGGTNVVNIGTSYDNIAIWRSGSGANTSYTLSYSANNADEITFKTVGSGVNLQINDNGISYITQTDIDKIIMDINQYAGTHTGINSVETLRAAMNKDETFKSILIADWGPHS